MTHPTSLASLSDQLVSLFDDERVSNDLNLLLSHEVGPTGVLEVTYPNGETASIPATANHTVLSVVLQRNLNLTFLEVCVFCALGGVLTSSNGLVYPKHGFALVKYNQDGLVYTYDLHNTQFYETEFEDKRTARDA